MRWSFQSESVPDGCVVVVFVKSACVIIYDIFPDGPGIIYISCILTVLNDDGIGLVKIM